MKSLFFSLPGISLCSVNNFARTLCFSHKHYKCRHGSSPDNHSLTTKGVLKCPKIFNFFNFGKVYQQQAFIATRAFYLFLNVVIDSDYYKIIKNIKDYYLLFQHLDRTLKQIHWMQQYIMTCYLQGMFLSIHNSTFLSLKTRVIFFVTSPTIH